MTDLRGDVLQQLCPTGIAAQRAIKRLVAQHALIHHALTHPALVHPALIHNALIHHALVRRGDGTGADNVFQHKGRNVARRQAVGHRSADPSAVQKQRRGCRNGVQHRAGLAGPRVQRCRHGQNLGCEPHGRVPQRVEERRGPTDPQEGQQHRVPALAHKNCTDRRRDGCGGADLPRPEPGQIRQKIVVGGGGVCGMADRQSLCGDKDRAGGHVPEQACRMARGKPDAAGVLADQARVRQDHRWRQLGQRLGRDLARQNDRAQPGQPCTELVIQQGGTSSGTSSGADKQEPETRDLRRQELGQFQRLIQQHWQSEAFLGVQGQPEGRRADRLGQGDGPGQTRLHLGLGGGCRGQAGLGEARQSFGCAGQGVDGTQDFSVGGQGVERMRRVKAFKGMGQRDHRFAEGQCLGGFDLQAGGELHRHHGAIDGIVEFFGAPHIAHHADEPLGPGPQDLADRACDDDFDLRQVVADMGHGIVKEALEIRSVQVVAGADQTDAQIVTGRRGQGLKPGHMRHGQDGFISQGAEKRRFLALDRPDDVGAGQGGGFFRRLGVVEFRLHAMGEKQLLSARELIMGIKDFQSVVGKVGQGAGQPGVVHDGRVKALDAGQPVQIAADAGVPPLIAQVMRAGRAGVQGPCRGDKVEGVKGRLMRLHRRLRQAVPPVRLGGIQQEMQARAGLGQTLADASDPLAVAEIARKHRRGRDDQHVLVGPHLDHGAARPCTSRRVRRL